MHFLVILKKYLPLKSYKLALTTFWKKYWWKLTQIFIFKKFEKEIVFECSVLAWIRFWIRIRIEQNCWMRIRIKSIGIHNPGF
jgi:hypothetical protein